jgi:uncharacterized protein (DUF2336 family)
MALYATLLPELEQAIRHGSTEKRADMAVRVTDLFIGAADHFDPQQIALFDQILGRLIEEIEQQTLAEISRRIAPVASAPIRLVRRLANDLDVAIAGPMLRISPRLADRDLAAVAQTKGPQHLLAISQRTMITVPITDILVQRGDDRVLHAIAANRGAQFSNGGFDILVARSLRDDQLAETVGLRPDIPAAQLRQLVRKATEIVRRRLIAAANPAAKQAISEVLTQVSAEVGAKVTTAYQAAQRNVLTLVREGRLDEAQLRAVAKNGQFEETVAMLSALSRIPIEVVERLMRGQRLDGLLILGRATGIEWPTVRAMIVLRSGVPSGPSIEEAKTNFERLSRASAERVARFWRGSKAAPAETASA